MTGIDANASRITSFVPGLFLAWFLLVGCQPNTSQPPQEASPSFAAAPTVTRMPSPTLEPTSTASPTATMRPPKMIGPDSYPREVNPLTGLVVDEPDVLARRPLLIKVSNSPPVVRPQSGISSADIVIENYAEGGWTRFAVIFYSRDVGHVGSVRSVRLVDMQLARAFDAIMVFSGGSRGVIDMVRLSPLYPYNTISPQFGYGEPYFVRFPREGLAFEHTLFTDTAVLRQWLAEKNVRPKPNFGQPGLAFTSLTPPRGQAARSAAIDYARTRAEWRYDPFIGAYLRWTDNIPHTDALTGQQLAFDNVIVISAYHDEVDLFPEKYFGEEKSLYIELEGSGPMTLLRDGQAFEGRWRRANEGDAFSFVAPDGDILPLKPGRTFIQIIRAGFEQLVFEP
ncbi:MAG: DUF3048 domain-containing protein [Anaerolineae bacterium]|nr:DUF3048 domain-containing protein [Anaerolineae bacterium]